MVMSGKPDLDPRRKVRPLPARSETRGSAREATIMDVVPGERDCIVTEFRLSSLTEAPPFVEKHCTL